MRDHDWKAGDIAEFKEDAMGYKKDGLYKVSRLDHAGDPILTLNGMDDAWFGCQLSQYAKRIPGRVNDELDAIERDMTDLFARMRAAIERLK